MVLGFYLHPCSIETPRAKLSRAFMFLTNNNGEITAILPEHFGAKIWSPQLNENRNSYKEMCFLEMFNQTTDSSVF